MPGQRRILVIDSDASISGWLGSVRLEEPLDVIRVADSAAGLDRLKTLAPDMIFVGVDLPDKEGFSVFTRLRRRSRQVPIVLATATLPAEDMKLHEKLVRHADFYLDKRAVTGAELLGVLNRFLSLGLSESQILTRAPAYDREAVGSPDPEPIRDDATAAPSDHSSPAGFAVDEALAELVFQEPRGAPTAERPLPGEPTRRIVQLEKELKQVRLVLEDARRAAASTPFSSEYLSLSGVIRAKEQEIDSLKEIIASRDRLLLAAKSTLGALRERLSTTEKEAGERLEQNRALEQEVGRLGGDVRRLSQETVSLREECRKATEALGQEAARHRKTREHLERELAASHTARAAMEQAHVVALSALEARLGNERMAAEVARETSLRAERDELIRRHEEKVTGLASEHQREMSSRQKFFEAERDVQLKATATQFATVEKKRRVELTRAEERRLSDLAKAEQDFEEERKRLTETYSAELDEIRKAKDLAVTTLEELRQRFAEALAESDRRARVGMETLQQKYQTRVDALEKAKLAALASVDTSQQKLAEEVRKGIEALDQERQRHDETRRRLEKDLSELRNRLLSVREQGTQEKQVAVRDASERVQSEKREAVDAERARAERELGEVRRKHEADEAALRLQHGNDRAVIEEKHRRELAAKEGEIYAAEKKAKLAADREIQRTLDAARRDHERAMAAARAEQDRQTASLEAEHRGERARAEEALGLAKDQLKAAELQAQETLAQMRRDHAAELAALKEEHSRGRTSAPLPAREEEQRAAENAKSLQARNVQLVKELAARRRDIEKRDETIRALETRLQEQEETVTSLRAVIGDSYRSIGEHIRSQSDEAETIGSLKDILESYIRERKETDETISSLKSVIRDLVQEPSKEARG